VEKSLSVRRGAMIRSNITTHWTEARVSLPFIRKAWMLDMLNARSVNSSVRFLLNDLAQKNRSVILNFTEAEDLLECSSSLNAVSLAQTSEGDAPLR
jgi:hypothetical protein